MKRPVRPAPAPADVREATAPRLACPDCDLLLRAAAPAHGSDLLCPRCGCELAHGQPPRLELALAFALTAAVLLVLANAFPILRLDASGNQTATTLFGSVRMLHDDGMSSVAALVFITIIAAPALEVAAVLYLLLPLHAGRVPRFVAPVSRLVHALRPWGMVEVFMLGALVAAAKLSQMATLHTGVALWSCAGLMVCVATVAHTFDNEQLWARVRRLGGDAG